MKVAIICTDFLPNIGGIQLNVYNLASHLINRGHEVRVLTSNIVGGIQTGLPSEEDMNGIQVTRLPLLSTVASNRFVIAPSIITKLFSLDAEIYHVFSVLPYFFTNVSSLILSLVKKPLVITPTYHPLRESIRMSTTSRMRRTLYYGLFVPRLLRKADCVIALTEKEAEYYRSLGIKRVHVVPVGVEIGQKQQSFEVEKYKQKLGLEGKVILVIGRLEERKGIQYALRALPFLLKDFPDLRLLIVGSDAGYLTPLKDLAEGLGVEHATVFAGTLSHSELELAYELSDVVVVPSVYEAFSHIVIEAWSHAKPVVASRTVGLAERVAPERGILFNLGDNKSLTRALSKLLSDEKLARLMGNQGRKAVQQEFTWDRVTSELEDAYRTVLLGKKVLGIPRSSTGFS
jgi:glycosyltransferase involved in cell wall biosynthesis